MISGETVFMERSLQQSTTTFEFAKTPGW